MSDRSELPDPAAIFAAALSLWNVRQQWRLQDSSRDPSNLLNGTDAFMRVIMRIATGFEEWASRHVAFEHLDDRWPCLLEDRFGHAAMDSLGVGNLGDFDERTCFRVGLRLGIPLKHSDELRVPVDVTAINPTPNSPFIAFRIQTVREAVGTDACVPYTADDDPFDEALGSPFFGLYGVEEDGILEHIADRQTYLDAISLAEKIAPGVSFPKAPMIEGGKVRSPLL